MDDLAHRGKVCRKCGQCKTYFEFRKNKESKDGIDSVCKECERARIKTLRTETPERQLAQLIYRESHANELGIYMKLCSCCHQEKPSSRFLSLAYTADGLNPKCKDCMNAARLVHRQERVSRFQATIDDDGRIKHCSKCGSDLPIKSFNVERGSSDGFQRWCRECHHEAHSRHYRKNPEYHRRRASEYKKEHGAETKAYRKLRYQNNREEEIAKASAWRKANPGKKSAQDKRHYAKHHQEIKLRVKQWGEENRPKIRVYKSRWGRKNRVKRNEIKHRRRAREWNTTVGEVDLEAIWIRDEGICHICGQPVLLKKDVNYDHVIPLSRGGTHTMDNIKVSYFRCNLIKGARLMDELNPAWFVGIHGNEDSLRERYVQSRFNFGGI